MSETDLMLAILAELGSRPDVRLWRQSVGAARTRGGRLVRFGLKGQADLSGILAGGRRLDIEVKAERGRQSPEQKAFGEVMTRFGGLYVVVRSVEEATAAIERAAMEGHLGLG